MRVDVNYILKKTGPRSYGRLGRDLIKVDAEIKLLRNSFTMNLQC